VKAQRAIDHPPPPRERQKGEPDCSITVQVAGAAIVLPRNVIDWSNPPDVAQGECGSVASAKSLSLAGGELSSTEPADAWHIHIAARKIGRYRENLKTLAQEASQSTAVGASSKLVAIKPGGRYPGQMLVLYKGAPLAIMNCWQSSRTFCVLDVRIGDIDALARMFTRWDGPDDTLLPQRLESLFRQLETFTGVSVTPL
jgi:hypothetical protein